MGNFIGEGTDKMEKILVEIKNGDFYIIIPTI